MCSAPDAIYDDIGHDYDSTRQPEPRIEERLRSLSSPPPGRPHLDLACGTGNYSGALSATNPVHGLDVSRVMLREARRKRPDIAWILGSAESLPYADDTFSSCSCVLAVHHFHDRRAAFREVHRVLGESARFVVLTASREQMRGYWLNEYFPVAMERSIEQMPELVDSLGELEEAGFASVRTEPFEVGPDHRDLFLYGPKHRPHLYLDPAVRRGISTFVNLTPVDELESGLRRLGADLESGRLDEVRARYEHDEGDYTFVIGDVPEVDSR